MSGPRSETTIWIERGILLAVAIVAIVIPMAPLGLTGRNFFVPDLLSAVILAWVIRRPDSAPFALIAMLALLADILLSRPPGLWALLLLLASEFMRSQRFFLREQIWVLEWLIVVLVLGMMLLAQYLLMGLVFAPQPGLMRSVHYLAMTAVAYPVVVAFLHWGLRIRAPRLKDGPDRLGRVA